MKKKNILIVIAAVITASFLLGKNSGFNKAESIHQTELKILGQSKLSQTPKHSINCCPEVNPNKDNYVIGYGSLMNKNSRQITVPNATYAAPILVSGFERLWASRGEKSRTTILTCSA